MLTEAIVTPSVGPAFAMDVTFLRPGEILASGMISDQYQIEYQTMDAMHITERDVVAIGGESFRVRQAPLVQGDGFFSIALLTKTA